MGQAVLLLENVDDAGLCAAACSVVCRRESGRQQAVPQDDHVHINNNNYRSEARCRTSGGVGDWRTLYGIAVGCQVPDVRYRVMKTGSSPRACHGIAKLIASWS